MLWASAGVCGPAVPGDVCGPAVLRRGCGLASWAAWPEALR